MFPLGVFGHPEGTVKTGKSGNTVGCWLSLPNLLCAGLIVPSFVKGSHLSLNAVH